MVSLFHPRFISNMHTCTREPLNVLLGKWVIDFKPNDMISFVLFSPLIIVRYGISAIMLSLIPIHRYRISYPFLIGENGGFITTQSKFSFSRISKSFGAFTSPYFSKALTKFPIPGVGSSIIPASFGRNEAMYSQTFFGVWNRVPQSFESIFIAVKICNSVTKPSRDNHELRVFHWRKVFIKIPTFGTQAINRQTLDSIEFREIRQ